MPQHLTHTSHTHKHSQQMYDVGAQLPKNGANHIDAHHSRQPLVKGERLVRYEVHAVIVSVLQLMECVYLKFNNDFKLKHVEEEERERRKGRPQASKGQTQLLRKQAQDTTFGFAASDRVLCPCNKAN